MGKCGANINDVLSKVAEEFCTSELKELRSKILRLEKELLEVNNFEAKLNLFQRN